MQFGDDLCRTGAVSVELVGGQDLAEVRVVVVVDLIRPVQVFLKHRQARWVTDVSRLDSLKFHTSHQMV